MYEPTLCVYAVPTEARRGCQVLWNWSRRSLLASQCGCWELNLCPIEEQQVLLTARPSLQPHGLFIISFTNVAADKKSVRHFGVKAGDLGGM